ncbi:type I-E CRISPR-associated protein Cas6/Cse3/CasE [[Lactobacillus] timonensis]|uniref:type I-E CRISPR-associated protein Cas6/Cse3/CasE n=1 Tax=[Lactobacillus] timonensis TaxID=1970790 RepID=UPI000C83254D|nr:type I-E CRISPR-associated protein Cas6/Cse3/CasE [[Lactobacillus] timonensis]
MYLSRVEIDTHNRQKMKSLSHLGAYHNWVEQSFPQEINQGQRLRHLWRIDFLGDKEYLLLLSNDKPDLNQLAKYGVTGTAGTKSYDHFLQQLAVGMVMQFRLTANPSYRDKESGRIYPHVTVAQQKQWLAERAERCGFQFVTNRDGEPYFDLTSREWPLLYHGKRKIKLSRASFEGALKITDLDKFKKALTEGIGREKAYGMGLLTVIPERR